MNTQTLNQSEFRRVLSHFPTGVVVVAAQAANGMAGMTLQSFTSLSLSPSLVMFSVDKKSKTWPQIAQVGKLAISVLGEDQAHVARQFARTGTDKFAGIATRPGSRSGHPIVDGAVAWFECSVEKTFEGGDHLIVVCAVEDLGAIDDSTSPLIFVKSSFESLVPKEAGVARVTV